MPEHDEPDALKEENAKLRLEVDKMTEKWSEEFHNARRLHKELEALRRKSKAERWKVENKADEAETK